MQTILERSEAVIVRDRSQFIGVLVHVTSIENIKQNLEAIKKEYPKAKHYCYAYILDDKKKAFDDGEPSKTAGRPLLELLERKEMNEVLLVVVRYFGGVLLGASRLMSTYLETGVETIAKADLLQIENRYVYRVELPYKDFDDLKRLERKLSFSLENVTYEDTIKGDILAKDSIMESLLNYFPNIKVDVQGIKRVYRR